MSERKWKGAVCAEPCSTINAQCIEAGGCWRQALHEGADSVQEFFGAIATKEREAAEALDRAREPKRLL